MYKIEEKDNKFYVIPTAETVLNNYNRFEMPYDSNWEIYKHFGFEVALQGNVPKSDVEHYAMLKKASNPCNRL